MTQWMTSKDFAKKWNVSDRWVSKLCRMGKIPSARKQGKYWMIPEDAQKPEDGRVRYGIYRTDKTDPGVSGISSAEKMPEENRPDLKPYLRRDLGQVSNFSKCIVSDEQGNYHVDKSLVHEYRYNNPDHRLPLPVGISNYRRAQSEYYYVDKTLLIRDLLDDMAMVTLFTRPRRFGKTLNMDMLRTFFEIGEYDTSIYFQDKKIWDCKEQYRSEQGRYPVIYLTFKDVKFRNWDDTFEMLKTLFRDEYVRHKELSVSNCLEDIEQQYYRKILQGNISKVELGLAVRNLSQMLYEHYSQVPVILIDEYDTPIQQGYLEGFYEEIVSFMRNLFSGGFKDNPYIKFGVLTGITRIAQESLFSGMNNLSVNSVLDQKYSEYFGFTPDEVQEIANYYGYPEKYPEICEWYDGYRFGDSEIFNPWSVINYFMKQCEPGIYWIATGNHQIIGKILDQSPPELISQLNSLMKRESVPACIDLDMIYEQLDSDSDTIYSFLMAAGYLKAITKELGFDGGYICRVEIPNKEILSVYKKEILAQLGRRNKLVTSSAHKIQIALFMQDTKGLQEALQNFLLQTISYYDSGQEIFYQGLLSGLLAITDHCYVVTSNRESGEGTYDFQLKPRDSALPGILIEIKASKQDSEKQMEASAEAALSQIRERQYDVSMKQEGIENIICYGIAFAGKKVRILSE